MIPIIIYTSCSNHYCSHYHTCRFSVAKSPTEVAFLPLTKMTMEGIRCDSASMPWIEVGSLWLHQNRLYIVIQVGTSGHLPLLTMFQVLGATPGAPVLGLISLPTPDMAKRVEDEGWRPIPSENIYSEFIEGVHTITITLKEE